MEGYCPVCGAWPAFAEMRGIERSRYLRCGRCGGGWQAQCLSCSYCGMTDHEELIVSRAGEKRRKCGDRGVQALSRLRQNVYHASGQSARQGHGR